MDSSNSFREHQDHQRKSREYLCEDHFRPEDYNNPLDPKSRLKTCSSVPSLFSFPQHLTASTSSKRKSPTKRAFSPPEEKQKSIHLIKMRQMKPERKKLKKNYLVAEGKFDLYSSK